MDAYLDAAGYALRQTMDGKAPWFIVEGADDNFRRATVLMTLRDTLAHHIQARRRLIKQRAKDLK